MQAVEDLLARDLGRERAVGQVGELVLGEQPRPLRHRLDHGRQQVLAAVAVQGRDDEGLGERIRLVGGGDQRQRLLRAAP